MVDRRRSIWNRELVVVQWELVTGDHVYVLHIACYRMFYLQQSWAQTPMDSIWIHALSKVELGKLG